MRDPPARAPARLEEADRRAQTAGDLSTPTVRPGPIDGIPTSLSSGRRATAPIRLRSKGKRASTDSALTRSSGTHRIGDPSSRGSPHARMSPRGTSSLHHHGEGRFGVARPRAHRRASSGVTAALAGRVKRRPRNSAAWRAPGPTATRHEGPGPGPTGEIRLTDRQPRSAHRAGLRDSEERYRFLVSSMAGWTLPFQSTFESKQRAARVIVAFPKQVGLAPLPGCLRSWK